MNNSHWLPLPELPLAKKLPDVQPADVPETASRPRERIYFAFTGNCQAMFLACAFNTLPNAEVGFFAGPYRQVRFEGQSAATEPASSLGTVLKERKAAGWKVVFCEQASPIAQITDPQRFGVEVDAVVRFPNVEAFVLWPDRKYDARQIERLTPERMLRLDQASVAAAEAKSDFGVALFIGSNFRERILYDSPRHPATPLLAELAGGILGRIDNLVSPAAAADLRRRIENSRGINTVFKHPVDAAMTDAIGCQWAQTPAYLNWRQANELFIDNKPAEAKALLLPLLEGTGDDPFFLRMIEPDAWTLLMKCERKLRDKAAADRAARRALEADPMNPQRYMHYASHLALSKDMAGVEACYRRASELNPDSGLYLELLGSLLAKQGRIDEAYECFRDAAVAEPRRTSAWRDMAAMELQRAVVNLQGAEQALQRLRKAGPDLEKNQDVLHKQIASLLEMRRSLSELPVEQPEPSTIDGIPEEVETVVSD